MNRQKTLQMVYYALFIGIIFILGLTPLGYITIFLVGITTVHIPVIIGSYSFGVKGGAILGFFFGLTSLIRCFMTPDATAAIILGTNTGFSAYNLFLIVAVIFVPRILVGVFAALVYKWLSKHDKTRVFAMGASAFVGSITNSVLFLGGLILFAFGQTAANFQLVNATYSVLVGTVISATAVNSIAEAIAAVILCPAIGKAILSYQAHQTKRLG